MHTKHSGCEPNPERKATTTVEKQNPCSFGSLLVEKTTGKSAYESSRGPICIENFFDYIRTKATEMFSAKQKFRKLVISNGTRKQLLLDSKNCINFHELLAKEELVHHDHTTGYILGVAHNSCNLKIRTQSFSPILFYNLSGYDSHHLIENLNLEEKVKLTVLPCTDENYLSFSLHVPVGEYMTKEGVMKKEVQRDEFS